MRLWTSGTLSPQGSKAVIWVTLVRCYKQIARSNPEEFVNALWLEELRGENYERCHLLPTVKFQVHSLFFFRQMCTWNG
jgi:hypothetical protein